MRAGGGRTGTSRTPTLGLGVDEEVEVREEVVVVEVGREEEGMGEGVDREKKRRGAAGAPRRPVVVWEGKKRGRGRCPPTWAPEELHMVRRGTWTLRFRFCIVGFFF